MPAPTKFIERYGLKFPLPETNDLNLELACYANHGAPDYNTGQPAEFHFKNAFRIMWPEEVFMWNDWMELMCWAWCNYSIVSVMGHTRAGKTFGAAHFALLDFLAVPQQTATSFTTTQFSALRSRLWGDMLRAIESSRQAGVIAEVFKVTSTSNEMRFATKGSLADDKYMIQGVATDRGDENASKLRGLNTPRRRIIGDEAQDIADGFYVALKHGLGSPDFKGWMLTNPVEKISTYGEWSKPKNGGWGSITDSDLFWETEHGIALHLDGRQSPNVKAGRVLNPNLMTKEYLDSLPEGTLERAMFGIGFFPDDGVVAKIWSNSIIEKASAGVEFDYEPVPFATLDPAFEGDDCAIHFGDIGTGRGGKAIGCFRSSQKIAVKVALGSPEADYQIARECIQLCRHKGIEPENFIMDTTGNGRGVFAIMRNEWAPKPGHGQVQGVSYGGEATERPLRLEDPLSANEQVKFFVAELWFRASYLARDGYICGLANTDSKTIEDLTSRRYTIKQIGERKLMVAETKLELKKRLGRSPDFGDAACQLGELMVRKGLLGGVLGQSKGNGWAQLRARAKRAQKRFTEEFASPWHD